MRVQVLHERGDEADCTIRVWVDDVEVKDAEVDDIDPGRGYTRGDWDERIADARDDNTAYGHAFLKALQEAAGSGYIR